MTGAAWDRTAAEAVRVLEREAARAMAGERAQAPRSYATDSGAARVEIVQRGETAARFRYLLGGKAATRAALVRAIADRMADRLS